MATSTFFPDPDPGTTSHDAIVYRSVASPGETFSTIRTSAGNTADSANIRFQNSIASSTTTDQYNSLLRDQFLFDTSPIPDGNSIDSAILSLFGDFKNDVMSVSGLDIVSSNPASNTSAATGDYGNIGTTQFATRKTFADYSTTAYNDFTLNTAGLAAISKTGVSKFGTRIGNDTDNIAPTWASNVEANFRGWSADQTGTANDPKLVVTHTPRVGGGLMLMGAA